MPFDEITSTGLSPRCMRCMLDKYLDACPQETPWRVKADYMRTVLRTVAETSSTMTAPEISYELNAVLEQTFGIKRDFSDKKAHFNELLLSLESTIAERIENSDEPLGLAIRLAMAGNFIDFGPTGTVDEPTLLKLVDDAAHMELDKDAVTDLEQRIQTARTITYLTDNCGEIVLDKLLIEQITRANPAVRIVAIVRGAPALNDATMEDALQVGLDRVATVLGNGSDLAGTSPSRVNEETRQALKSADLVISKGLANYETLSGRGVNTYFLFLCKCALYVELFDVPLYTGMIVRGV